MTNQRSAYGWSSLRGRDQRTYLHLSSQCTPVFLPTQYDEVSDLWYNWVAQRPDFKSTLRVVKMVLNTQCYLYLGLTMWFHAKNPKKHSLILLCKFCFQAQKLPKIPPKTSGFAQKKFRFGIFYMVPGESSCPGDLEYECQRGVEGVLGWVTDGRSWPSFKKEPFLWCPKNAYWAWTQWSRI